MSGKIGLVLGISLFLILVMSGCTREPYAIEFASEIIDFGSADEGTYVDIVFEFTNKGTEILKIEAVKPACGCTTPENWDKVVEPGKKGKIPIVFNTKAYQGDVTKGIDIKTNIPGSDSIKLTIQGNVFNPVQVFPRSTWMGEILDETKPVSDSFILTNNKELPIKPTDIILPDENTTFNLVTLQPGKEYRLDITVNPPFELYKDVRKSLKIKTWSTPESVLEIYYSYMVPPPVKISPEKMMVNLSDIATKTVEQRINIKSYITEPIDILDVEFTGPPEILLPVDPLSPGKFYQIPLKFPSGFTFGEDEKGFILSFRVKNDPRELVYRIPVEGYRPEN